jgi:transposase InsO family protein
MSNQCNKKLTLDALKMELIQRKRHKNVILHSNQGMEYRTSEYHQVAE